MHHSNNRTPAPSIARSLILLTRTTALAVVAAATLFGSGCRSLSRDVNNSLPEFLRSDPGAEEVARFEMRRRVANRTPEEKELAKNDYLAAKAVYESGLWADAARDLRLFLDNYPDTEYDREARVLFIRASMNDDEYGDAKKALLDYMAFYPVSEFGVEIEQIGYDLGMSYLRGEQDFLFISGTDEGVRVLRELYAHFPGGTYADDAHWQLGQYFFLEEEVWTEAENEYTMLVESYPDSPWAARAQYNLALTRLNRIKGVEYDEKLMKETITSFETYLSTYAEGDRREESAQHVADIRELLAEKHISIADWYIGQDQPRGARFYLMRMLKLYPSSKWVGEAEAMLATLPPEDAPLPADNTPFIPGTDSMPTSQPTSGNP